MIVTINIQEHIAIDDISNPAGLAAKICKKMSQDGIILTTNGEGLNFTTNKLYSILDEICKITNYPKNKIYIETWNLLEHHDHYNILRKDEIYDTKWFLKPDGFSKPCDNKILILMGKANEARLRVHELVQNVSWRDKILYSFHINLHEIPWPPGLKDRLMDGQNYNFYKNSTPMSDISVPLPTPIVPPLNIGMLLPVYDRVALEIVVETVTDEGFFVTEKTLRPILYGRPFLTIAPKGYESNLRKLGFDLDFGFPKYLEDFGHKIKADLIFEYLDKWSYSEDWFDSLLPKLKHNQQVLKSIAEKKGKIDLSLFNI